MGTEILRPQDCLIERFRVSPCRRKNYYYYNNNSYSSCGNANNTNPKIYDSSYRFNRKPAVRSEKTDQRKRQPELPVISKRSNSVGDLKVSKNQYQNHGYKSSNGQILVMEKVMILRRGESLDSKIHNSENASLKKDQAGDIVVTGTDRLGPGPEMVPKQIRIADIKSPVAAGKSDVYAGSAFAVSPAPSSLPLPSFQKKKQISFDDSATRDLRRLLRLDF